MASSSLFTALGLCMVLSASTASADARIVSGRISATESVHQEAEPSSIRLLLGGGVSAAGDVFAYESSLTRSVTTPLGGSFMASRFTATLDEDVLIDLGLLIRISSRAGIRVSGRWSEMGLTALANDSQIVTPSPWDVVTFTQLTMLYEQALAVGKWVPFIAGGASWLKVDAMADVLDQQGVSPTLGVGLRVRTDPRFGFWAEILDTVRQIESNQLMGEVLPGDGEFTEFGPQHLVGLTIGIELGF